MTLVVDASIIVALLIDTGDTGTWAESLLDEVHVCAPHLMPVEVVNVLRRAELSGTISADVASLAHEDLLDLQITLLPYEPFAARVWELHHNVTAYDAWYVAVAEQLDADLATLDVALSKAVGVQCGFMLPDAAT